ncbi:hypothetical protein [Aliiroseovarius lamellibrachiae]|uniref:hypothetical protein n=1 Tax=Aliiroseovarius lamellibrachiae TaxID=1924933 RepID=UPI001BE0A22E|nr:hypothetical protein [Aliiroseovarius lamellibrachiae]MBT2129917.1 hypothetical protein [Aliiroseovarius lamellibrachiae]
MFLGDRREMYEAAIGQMGPLIVDDPTRDLWNLRVVHDLGLAGDDFEEFYEVLQRFEPTENKVPRRFIPSELSRDAYYVACATGYFARRFPWLRRRYVRKLSVPELRLKELDRRLYS